MDIFAWYLNIKEKTLWWLTNVDHNLPIIWCPFWGFKPHFCSNRWWASVVAPYHFFCGIVDLRILEGKIERERSSGISCKHFSLALSFKILWFMNRFMTETSKWSWFRNASDIIQRAVWIISVLPSFLQGYHCGTVALAGFLQLFLYPSLSRGQGPHPTIFELTYSWVYAGCLRYSHYMLL
jgi:hypothetical protein